ncbi:hypothetical protein KPA97_50125 [Burkholderia cenocepacia]|nr:hypothetical protein [Burkholderia cenocepacia]MDR5668105.1 hypothetical protein [Burkholderia cenocepacia]
MRRRDVREPARERVRRQPRIPERRLQPLEFQRLRIVDRIHPRDMNVQCGNSRNVVVCAVDGELPAVRAMSDPQCAVVLLSHHDEPRHAADAVLVDGRLRADVVGPALLEPLAECLDQRMRNRSSA